MFLRDPKTSRNKDENIIYALRQDESQQPAYVVEEDPESEDKKHKRIIVCRECFNEITYPGNKIVISGTHAHVFFNPHGIVFEIGCFSKAHGCLHTGAPTLEFTWFDGYAWNLALCSRCLNHLGWKYQSESGDGFYGLILSNLVEQDVQE